MSILTKIFIVLMVVFSIAFTMMAISFAAKTNEWRTLANDYRSHQLVVESNLRNLAAAHAAEAAAWGDTKEALLEEKNEYEQQVGTLNQQISELTRQLAEAKDAGEVAQASVSRLTISLQTEQEHTETLRDQLAKAEEDSYELTTRNRELKRRVDELGAQVTVLVQQQRQLEQQVNMLEDNTEMAAGSQPRESIKSVTARNATPKSSSASSSPIKGRIIEVQGDIATLTVGSADGVRPGMTFVVYRDPGEYVGDINIVEVEPNMAAGRVTNARTPLRTGDQVADEPAFGLAN